MTYGSISPRVFGQSREDNFGSRYITKEQNESITKPAGQVSPIGIIDEFENVLLRPSMLYRLTGWVKYSVDNVAGMLSLSVSGAGIVRVSLNVTKLRFNTTTNAIHTTLEALDTYTDNISLYPGAINTTYVTRVDGIVQTGIDATPYTTWKFKVAYESGSLAQAVQLSIKSGSYLLFQEIR